MRVNDTLAVQMLQSRLRQMEAARQYPQIPQMLFTKLEEPSVEIAPDAPVAGLDAVNLYYHALLGRSEAAGGFLRGDLATTQAIRVDEDGQHAIGTWLTFGTHVTEAPVEERKTADVIGLYRSECCVENGRWRIRSLRWTPLLRVKPVPYQEKANHAFSVQHQEQWPHPPAQLHELRTVDPAAQSENAVRTLEIENAFGQFLQDAARCGWQAAVEGFLAPDAKLYLEENAPITGASAITAALAQKMDFALATSRVIRPETGTATWAGMSVRRAGSKAEVCWGRFYVTMTQRAEGWRCEELKWITVAALDPWELEEGGAADAGR